MNLIKKKIFCSQNATVLMHPLHYSLHLEPDIPHFTFHGTCEILISTADPIDHITLNAKDLQILSCFDKTASKSSACAFSLNPDKEELTVSF